MFNIRLVAIGTLLLSGYCGAQFVPVSQSRSIQGEDSITYYYRDPSRPPTVNQTHDSRTAPDFSSFNQSLATYPPISQSSSITPSLITGSGQAGGSGSISGPGNIVSYSTDATDGSSLFGFTFNLTAPTSIVLSGTIHEDQFVLDLGQPNASIVLRQVGGPVLASAVRPLQAPLPIDVPLMYAATLDPGQYTLSAAATTRELAPADPLQSFGGTEESSFQFTFQAVPEPGALLAPCLAVLTVIGLRVRAQPHLPGPRHWRSRCSS